MPVKWRSDAVVEIRSLDRRPLRDLVAEMSQHVFTNAGLADLIMRNDLYPADRAHLPMQDVIETAKRNIQIRPVQNDPNVFQVAFTYSDAKIAQRMTNYLLNMFVAENMRIAEEAMERNTSMIPTIVRVAAPAKFPDSPVRPNLPALTAFGAGGRAFVGIVAMWLARRHRNAIVG